MNAFVKRLDEGASRFTKSERQISSYLLHNPDRILFETVSGIAEAVGVSEMTVNRMLRSMGYRGLRQVREEISESSLRAPARLLRYESDGRDVPLNESLEREISALVDVYRMVETEPWRRIVDLLATSERVYVAGFQAARGLAMDFASYMEYVRPGMRFVDGLNGTYSEVFGGADTSKCLVIVDVRRYAVAAEKLAAAAAVRGIPLVVLTDTFCHWAREHTANVLSVRTDVKLFWDSRSTMSSLLNLLTNSLVKQRGDESHGHMETVSALQSDFACFL